MTRSPMTSTRHAALHLDSHPIHAAPHCHRQTCSATNVTRHTIQRIGQGMDLFVYTAEQHRNFGSPPTQILLLWHGQSKFAMTEAEHMAQHELPCVESSIHFVLEKLACGNRCISTSFGQRLRQMSRFRLTPHTNLASFARATQIINVHVRTRGTARARFGRIVDPFRVGKFSLQRSQHQYIFWTVLEADF